MPALLRGMKRRQITASSPEKPSFQAEYLSCLESPSKRRKLTSGVMHFLNRCSLSKSDQLRVLGFSPRNYAAWTRFACGTPIPPSPDLVQRAVLLRRIQRSLTTASKLESNYLVTPSCYFCGRTPVEVIVHEGIAGLLRVSALLTAAKSSKSRKSA